MISFWPREADDLCAWGVVVVMQSVSTANMLACSLIVLKVKSCFVILGSLNNFIGDHLSKLQRVPAKFQRFWQFRQKFDN